MQLVTQCVFQALMKISEINDDMYSIFSEEWFPEGKQNILPGPISETLVPGLRPWTVYHLRLFAENQLGKSKEGKVLQVRNNEKCHN